MNDTYVDAQSSQMKMKVFTLASGLIASVLVLSFMLKVPQVHAQTSCDYYASPNGTGNGNSPSTPFQVSNFWSVATPGKVLCLLNGTYSDDNSLIEVPDTFAGTASQPITIRALNDGQVLIAGGSRRPVNLQGSYGILEGINATGSANASFKMRGTHWIARRVIVWNNTEDGGIVMDGYNNTIEDCAVFGMGRKIFIDEATTSNGGNRNNVARRCWARWESRLPGSSPNNTYEMGYGMDGVIYENVIGTRDRTPGANSDGDDSGPFSLFRTKNSQWLGSIVYATAGSNFEAMGLMGALGDWGYQSKSSPHAMDNVLLKDIVAIVEAGYPDFDSVMPFEFYSEPASHPQQPVTNTVQNLVGVAGKPSLCESPTWSGCASIRQGRTIAAAIGSGKSIWNEVPGICRRYVNGQLTSTPLWPWPMNQRIKDALVQSGRTPVDVTQTMEDMLGPIPQACKTGSPDPVAMPQPRNLRVLGAK